MCSLASYGKEKCEQDATTALRVHTFQGLCGTKGKDRKRIDRWAEVVTTVTDPEWILRGKWRLKCSAGIKLGRWGTLWRLLCRAHRHLRGQLVETNLSFCPTLLCNRASQWLTDPGPGQALAPTLLSMEHIFFLANGKEEEPFSSCWVPVSLFELPWSRQVSGIYDLKEFPFVSLSSC